MCVQMTRSEYLKLPADYRSEKEGVYYALLGENGATVLTPVEFTDSILTLHLTFSSERSLCGSKSGYRSHVKYSTWIPEPVEARWCPTCRGELTVAVQSLTCCCCGEETQGRQWWNRDSGYGLCLSCANEIEQKYGREYVIDMAGEKGWHYGVEAK